MAGAERLVTRRAWGRVVAGTALARLVRRAQADASKPARLTWAMAPGPEGGEERRYRATAQILVLSIPLFRWSNVGGGSSAWRETALPENGTVRFLEFTGYSDPKHAHGLNRLGLIRELSRLGEKGATDSLYFGLMTTSPEETAEEAKKALHSISKEAAYTTIDARLSGGRVDTAMAHFMAPSGWSVQNRDKLIQLARKALAGVAARPFEGDAPAGVRPFLQTLADALRQTSPAEARFAYAGRFYRLWVESARDPKATADFRKRGLVGPDREVVRVSGKLRREAGGKQTEFRLWVEEGAARPLPLRIEYQARSFLRLIFETEG